MPVDIALGSGEPSVALPLMGLFRLLLPPVFVFGSPVQRSKNETCSYWHVPIGIRRRFKIGPGVFPRAGVFLDRYEGRTVVERIKLSWGDAVFSDTGDTATLMSDEGPILVPVAIRHEGDDRNGYLVDIRHVRGREKPYPIPPIGKKLNLRLE